MDNINLVKTSNRLAALVVAMLFAAACGGGGGNGGGGTPAPNNDTDNDGVINTADNCPNNANAAQTDTDGDGAGDACDADDDNDGVGDANDNCPVNQNAGQTNTDGDAFGDVCDNDDDNDNVTDATDNCPLVSNNDQADNDADGAGDVCDDDDDNDTIADANDNCPFTANTDQADADMDGIGDVCDMNNTVSVSGKVTFDKVPHDAGSNGLDYASIVVTPARNVLVEVVEAATDSVLANAETDDAGDYSADIAMNTNIYVRARVESVRAGTPAWNVRVVDNTQGDALYVLESADVNTGVANLTQDLHAASGWDGSNYSSTRAAAPFAVLDGITTAMNAVLAADPTLQIPNLTLKWSPDNRAACCDESMGEIGNTFFRRTAAGDREILLLGNEDTDTDEYDTHVVVHEWGHFFEDAFARADTVGGPHSAGDRLDPRVAYSEGFGYAFAGIALDDPVTRDSLGFDQASGFQIDVESNNNLNPGWFSEGSAQSIIYDVVDTVSDGLDTVSLGFSPLYTLLTGDLKDSVPPITLFSFVALLKQQNPGIATDIDAIVNDQGIDSNAIDEYANGETHDEGRGADVLPVYSTLTVGAPATTVCSLGGPSDFGTFNKLSVRRFLRLDIATAGNYVITASGPAGADPDIVLHQSGFIAVYELIGSTETTPALPLSPGTYVVEVYEFSNITDFPRGRTCIDVSVN